MEIHQFLTSYSYGDAIGNEALEIRHYLRKKGYRSEIFALFYHPKYSDQIINYLEYDKYSREDNVIIFHFSIGSPVSKQFLRFKDKKAIIYHNITPHKFFLDYHRTLAKDCFKGRIELKNFVDKVDLALGDSEYNTKELIELGFKNTGVVPLVMNFNKFNSEVLPSFKNIFDDNKTNITYVGRIIPNKKIEDVIKSFYFYQKFFNSNSRLFIVGEYRGFERYFSAIQKLILKLGVKDVHISGHVPEDELISYFKLSDVYLHMSEHEGFCAPIPESYYLKIPVIAFNAGAVKETMNKGGLLVNHKNYIKIASLIDTVINDKDLRDKIIKSQDKALNKYKQNKTGSILLKYIEGLLNSN